MGLSVEIGWFGIDTDAEWLERRREELGLINRVLEERELPPHSEPETLQIDDQWIGLGSFPYLYIHHLRRAYAHREADPQWVAPPLYDIANPTEDPVYLKALEQDKSHLICHSDTEGYYLPIEFDEILMDERITGYGVGSSAKLLDELRDVAPAIGIDLVDGELPPGLAEEIDQADESLTDHWIERNVWLTLFQAAKLSLKYRAVVNFC